MPQNRCGVGICPRKSFMAAFERTVAKIHTRVKNLPEPVQILFRRKTYINKINRYNALIKSAVILGLAVLVNIRRQEASAAHARVAVTLAVFINLCFKHYLLRNIVRNHSLCRTLSRKLSEVIILAARRYIILLKHVNKLRKCRGYPYTFFVFNALIALFERLLDYQCKVMFLLLVFRLAEIHKHCYKRCLSVCCHERYNLVLNHLNAIFNLVFKSFFRYIVNHLIAHIFADKLHFLNNLPSYLFAADVNKRRKMCKAYALTAVLTRRNLRDNLR